MCSTFTTRCYSNTSDRPHRRCHSRVTPHIPAYPPNGTDVHPHLTVVPWANTNLSPNCISIGSSAVAGQSVVTKTHTDRPRYVTPSHRRNFVCDDGDLSPRLLKVVVTVTTTFSKWNLYFGQENRIFLATRSVMWPQICRKCNSGRGSAPDPAGRAHDAPPDFLVGGGVDTPPHTPTHSAPLAPRCLILQRLDRGALLTPNPDDADDASGHHHF